MSATGRSQSTRAPLRGGGVCAVPLPFAICAIVLPFNLASIETIQRTDVRMRITEEYREANKRLHEINERYGTSGAKWARKVSQLVQSTGSSSVLDYGCGKGLLAAALPELGIREYDPAIPGKDSEPESAEFVVCTDVLEHIETDCLDAWSRFSRSSTGRRSAMFK